MSRPATPQFHCEQHHATLSVSDVPAAADFYVKKLGFQLTFVQDDPPTFAGVNLGHAQIFLSRGTPAPQGCSVYFVVDDADALLDFQRSNGVESTAPPTDKPYGLREYRVRDLDGYTLTFGHRLPNAEPPLKIERVDVQVRLEKRLAALLQDLAEHKRMSVSSCLEEILLHTCEPYGAGVASPHTNSTLRHIQQLKAKHGIDYDTHASYRFTEGESKVGSSPASKSADS